MSRNPREGQDGREPTRSPAHRRTLLAAGLGLAVTLLVSGVPVLRFAYRSHDGRLALETGAALIAALVAVLFYGRFRRSGSLQALLLVGALGLLGAAAFGLVLLPVLAGGPAASPATIWAALVVRQLGALFLLAAALAPARVVRRPGGLREGVALALLLVVVVVVAVRLLARELPMAVTTHPPPETSAAPSFDAHPLVLAVQAGNLLCFAVAAIAFTRQSARTGDALAGWVGAAAAVGAFARVNYLLYPSLYTDWFYTGDLLQLGFYFLLLVGVWREINDYWSAQAEAAVFRERRRLARELHDGTLQEIGYIRSRAATVEGPVAAQIRSATDRAIDETRAALAALAGDGSQPFTVLLRRSVEEVADRYDVAVRWSVEPHADAPPGHRDDLLRIAREAVSNAARHGRARTTEVHMSPGRLAIADDGAGFDPGAPTRPGAFGLTSMRDRAAGMGGTLEMESTPGHGTTVRVTWQTRR